jgi:succinate dehydrogenase / fumarate reductase cytochrome b subunit
MPKGTNRPIFLDLTRIRQPITALISIAHRIAGIILFFTIPFAIYLLDLSVGSQRGFNRVQDILSHGAVKVAVICIFWALAHHIFAGMRLLFIDVGIGVEREEARHTAWVILVASAAALLMAVGIILW